MGVTSEASAVSDPSNVRHLVEETMRLLAVGELKIKHRLLYAYTHKLQYVFPEHVPSNLSPLLESIRQRLFREPRHRGQSTVESALYRMHSKTAATIAGDIVELHLALRLCRP